jgi:hypothetical protein
MILLAPSGSGKTVLLSNLILNIYCGRFERIFVFSPSIDLNSTWEPVKKYQSDTLKVRDKTEEKLYFNSYDPEDLERIIDTQHKITKYVKKQGREKEISILVVIDDFADDANFTRHYKLLHSLYTRDRHNSISTIFSTQKIASIHPIIRVNATSLIVYRLRNNRELESFLEEVSGLTGEKELLEIYRLAAKEEFSFLYVNLSAHTVNEMFFVNFKKHITIEENEED